MAACATTQTAAPFPTTTVDVGGTELVVWVADTPEERSQGLRGVESLPEGVEGMLFVFSPDGATPSFVMEDTLIPLDLWFFEPEGRLVQQVGMTPCTVDPCPLYPAPTLVAWALETPAGVYRFPPGSNLVVSP